MTWHLTSTEILQDLLRSHKIYWDLTRSTEISQDLLRSHKIYWDLTRSTELSQDLLRSHKIYWFGIIHYTFGIWHLTCHDIPWHLTLICHGICHLTFAIWHLTFAICHLTFDIWHLTFDIWHLTLLDMILSYDINSYSLMDSVVILAIWVWLVTHSLSRNLDLRDASASKNSGKLPIQQTRKIIGNQFTLFTSFNKVI